MERKLETTLVAKEAIRKALQKIIYEKLCNVIMESNSLIAIQTTNTATYPPLSTPFMDMLY